MDNIVLAIFEFGLIETIQFLPDNFEISDMSKVCCAININVHKETY